MDNKISEAFAQLKMDELCANNIQERMKRSHPAHRIIRYAVIVTACVAFVFLICSNPNVVQALEETFIAPILNLSSQSDPTEAEIKVPNPPYAPDYRRPDGGAVFEEDPKVDNAVIQLPKNLMPFCLKIVDGRLFFTANGENIDITDSFSEEIPFTYVFTDESGYTHYMAVGGTFDPEMTPSGGVGYHEWIRDKSQADEGRYVGWLNGGGTIPNNPDEEWIWLETAKKMFDVPWN